MGGKGGSLAGAAGADAPKLSPPFVPKNPPSTSQITPFTSRAHARMRLCLLTHKEWGTGLRTMSRAFCATKRACVRQVVTSKGAGADLRPRTCKVTLIHEASATYTTRIRHQPYDVSSGPDPGPPSSAARMRHLSGGKRDGSVIMRDGFVGGRSLRICRGTMMVLRRRRKGLVQGPADPSGLAARMLRPTGFWKLSGEGA